MSTQGIGSNPGEWDGATAMAISNPQKYGAQWGCLADGCGFTAPHHSKEAVRHPATHRRKLTDRDRKALEADRAKAGAIFPTSVLCQKCDTLWPVGSVHACGLPATDTTLPHEASVSAWRRQGLKESLDELAKD